MQYAIAQQVLSQSLIEYQNTLVLILAFGTLPNNLVTKSLNQHIVLDQHGMVIAVTIPDFPNLSGVQFLLFFLAVPVKNTTQIDGLDTNALIAIDVPVLIFLCKKAPYKPPPRKKENRYHLSLLNHLHPLVESRKRNEFGTLVSTLNTMT
jgi:hypothetical protein